MENQFFFQFFTRKIVDTCEVNRYSKETDFERTLNFWMKIDGEKFSFKLSLLFPSKIRIIFSREPVEERNKRMDRRFTSIVCYKQNDAIWGWLVRPPCDARKLERWREI